LTGVSARIIIKTDGVLKTATSEKLLKLVIRFGGSYTLLANYFFISTNIA